MCWQPFFMKLTNEFIIETSAKALISFIPYVGGAIGSELSDIQAERKQQRINEFLVQFKNDLDSVGYSINFELLKKDDFLDIFELTLKKVIDERKDTKRFAYRNILINGVILPNSNFDDIEQCIRIMENTTEDNIYLLRVLFDP